MFAWLAVLNAKVGLKSFMHPLVAPPHMFSCAAASCGCTHHTTHTTELHEMNADGWMLLATYAGAAIVWHCCGAAM